MLIRLHKQVTTTPKLRAAIQVSDAPTSVLAERFGTTEQTVYRGVERVRSRFILTMAANNPARSPRLLGAGGGSETSGSDSSLKIRKIGQ